MYVVKLVGLWVSLFEDHFAGFGGDLENSVVAETMGYGFLFVERVVAEVLVVYCEGTPELEGQLVGEP